MVAFNLVPGLLGISLFVFASVGGLLLVQRLVPIELRKQHNDVAGFIYAVVGIAYAVLLGRCGSSTSSPGILPSARQTS